MIIASGSRVSHGGDVQSDHGLGVEHSVVSESEGAAAEADSFSLADALTQLGVLTEQDSSRLPTFMVVSPPKTGTSWLFAILQLHPEVAVPHDKETHFFSTFYRWCDLSWYLSRFGDRPTAQRGEASPTYAILPSRIIRTIHALMPKLKLIFLLRDPVERAWSHARHSCRYGEANFTGQQLPMAEVPEAMWQENFRHPWTSVSGDYLGQLRRWRAFFPRKQFYIAFFEQIIAHPAALLGEVFDFLQINHCQVSPSLLKQRINEGLAAECSKPLLRDLREIYLVRTRQLADYLWDEFRVQIPGQWSNTLAHGNHPTPVLSGPMKIAADHEFDDQFLFEAISHEQRPEFPWAFGEPYLGYNLFLFRHQVYGVAERLGTEFLARASAADLQAAQQAGHCLAADNLRMLREKIAKVLPGRPSAG